MWFLVVLFVASLVVSLVLVPKPKITNATAGKLSDVSFPRADEGSPIPRWYGTCKFQGPNTIYDGRFQALPIKVKVKTGLFSSKKQTTGYQYLITMDMAIALGPGFNFRRLWFGNYEIWNGCLTECENTVQIDLPNLYGGSTSNGGVQGTVVMFCGNYDQGNDEGLNKVLFPNGEGTYPSYPGVAHVCFHDFWVGNSTSIQPLYVEGSCFPDSLDLGDYLIMPNGFDMNPIGIIHHIICDDWGCLGVDPERINTAQWQEVAQKVYAEGFGSSLIVSNAGTASAAVTELLTQLNGKIYQNPSTGLWDFVLVRDDYVIADLPVLGPSEVSSVQDFTKTLWSQTFNVVRVTFTDRTQGYKDDTVAQAQDFANIRFQGQVRPDDMSLESVYDPDVANMIAARELSNVNIPLYSMTLKLNRTHPDLAPGSPFVLNWPEYGIEQMVLRVSKFGLGTMADGTISMDCVQDVFSASNVLLAPPTAPPSTAPDTSAKAIANYRIFELPYWLDYQSLKTDAGYQSMGVFALAPSSYSVGFNAFIVGTDDDDAQVLDLAPYADTAVLNADLDILDGWETGVLPTLVVKSVSNVAGLTDDATDTRLGHGLFLLNDEFMAYESYVDNGDGTYNLVNVHRALMDTGYASAVAGDVLYFVTGQDDFLDDSFVIGDSFQMYLQDQTVSDIFDADNAARIVEVPIGRLDLPLPPDDVTVAGAREATDSAATGSSVALAWSPRNRFTAPLQLDYETDPAAAIEADVTFEIDLVAADGTVASTMTGIAVANADFAIDAATPTGAYMFKVWAALDGTRSYSPSIYPIEIVSDITVDGDVITVDGNGVLL